MTIFNSYVKLPEGTIKNSRFYADLTRAHGDISWGFSTNTNQLQVGKTGIFHDISPCWIFHQTHHGIFRTNCFFNGI
jgi:hypothetical protein